MLNNLDLKKIYYYTICVIAFFVFMWGAIDLSSASISLFTTRSQTAAYQESGEEKTSEPFVDIYYQRKMLYDRLLDSLSRVVIAGIIFTYSRIQAKKLDVS